MRARPAFGFVLISLLFLSAEGPALSSPVSPADAPLGLTAADGTGLELVSLKGRAVVEAPLAFTELTLAFRNPADRVIEGHFRITLPPGATVSRFAMRLGDRWQEGEVVERQAARRAYEDFLHRRQDPALLEQGAANEFTARVFPIEARGVKEIILSYSQELDAGESYALPLRGLPQLGELDVEVAIDGASAGELKKSRYVPSQDFPVSARGAARAGLRHDNLVLVRVKPQESSLPDRVKSLTILVDSSASRALGFEEQTALVKKLIAALDPATEITVACFDQTVEQVHSGAARAFGDAASKKIRDRRALGASDLQMALRWAGEAGAKRVLIVGDGVATAGATEGDELTATVLKLKPAVERIDAVVVGGIRDEDALSRIVRAGLSRDGIVVDGGTDVATIVRRLNEATRSNLVVAVEGASWVWPRKLDGVQAGDEITVWADLPAKKRDVKVTIGGTPVKVGALAAVDRPLLERAFVQAKISGLLHDQATKADGPEAKKKIREEIVDLSVQHRVLSPYTALLVLETEDDYARFGIDRKALADVMTVEGRQIRRKKRAGDALAFVPVERVPGPANADLKKNKSQREVAKPETGMAGDVTSPTTEGLPSLEQSPEPKVEESADFASGDAAPSMDFAPSMDVAESSNAVVVQEPVSSRPPPAPVRAPPAERQARDSARSARGQGSASGRGAGSASSSSADGWERGDRADASDEEIAGARGRPKKGTPPWTGKFADVMGLVAKGQKEKAVATARGWLEESPGDVMALVALGEALEAAGDPGRAARAYGSIIDLFPSRADLRRFAGVRLERIRGNAGLDLAIDTYRKAVEQRPDHPASHRLLAFSLLKKGASEKAFDAAAAAVAQKYPDGRFRGVERILAEDLGLVAAAWMKAEPNRRADIARKLGEAGGVEEKGPSLRFILNWETDANDVDFHIYDAKGNHAFYSAPQLRSGGELYGDVTTGYGPECFTIREAPAKRAGPYTIQAHYYRMGPMGYGMGKLQIVEHDGNGGITFEERPFVVMVDEAFVDLGVVKR